MKLNRSILLAVALAAVAFAGAALASQTDMAPMLMHAITSHADMTSLMLAVAPAALPLGAASRALKARKAEALKEANSIAAISDRDLTADEQAKLTALTASIGSLNAQIDQAEFLAKQDAGLDDRGFVEISAHATIHNNAADDPKGGYAHIGEFLKAVTANPMTEGTARPGYAMGGKLQYGQMQAAAPGTYGGEGSGADGGFLVPPAFSDQVFTLTLQNDAFVQLTDNTPVSGNGMVFPKDETTPWGANGVRAYWQAEAGAGTQTKPVLGTQAMRLHKLLALVPMTNELIEDAAALGGYVPNLMARSIRWKTNEAILFGTGEGQPQGLFNSPANVVQPKDGGQAASTVTIGNITNMIARLPDDAGDAIWLVTPDALPSVYTMTLGNYPVFLPASSGAIGKPEGMLMGRPIYKTQHAPAFSTQGDVSLVSLSWYRTITKANAGVQVDTSMHLYFDADAMAFRARFRIDGGSKIAAPISQAKGSKTLSPFIQLQAR